MKRVETEASLRGRLTRLLLAYGAFRTAGIMQHENHAYVLRALTRLIRELDERGDPRAGVIHRIRDVFKKSTGA